jgi:hypothetical protein
MSRKSKLILATALFGAALFAASCGGGDSGGTTAGTGTGGGGGGGTGGGGGGGGGVTPSPTEEGKVLALLDVGGASAGPLKPVAICRLMSNEKAECGTDLNLTADVELEYLYEFPIPDGNVVLKVDSTLYFFNGSQVVRPTSYRTLGGTSDISEPGGIAIPTGTITYYPTDDFVIIHSTGGGGTVIAVSKTGKVIRDNGVSSTDINRDCKTVTKSSNTFKLNVDGTSSNITATIPDEVVAEAGDKFLVKKGTQIRLSSSRCSITGSVLVATTTSFGDAKMVKVGEDFYIAVRDGTTLYYRKVSGSAVPVSVNISLASGDKHYYALDGRGRLYAITAGNTVSVRNTDGTLAGTATVTGVTFTGLLGLADRALAKTSSDVYEITTTGSTASAANKGGGTLHSVVDNCTHSDTIAIDGAGTNFIRCAHSSGLYSLAFDSGSGLYSRASNTFSISAVKFATGKVLVRSGTNIILCSTTTSSISCSNTDLPGLDPTNINHYLKFNGSEVFYLSGSTLKVGDIFGPPSALSITVSPPGAPTGGNASFNLNKFAFRFTPAVAPCATHIAYLSSRTASPKYYELPSGTCVKRILKVFP